MHAIEHADTRRLLEAAASAAGPEQVDVYLTDEVFLYRVADAAGELVDIEDCILLDVVRVPLAAVQARRLRVVTPARGHA